MPHRDSPYGGKARKCRHGEIYCGYALGGGTESCGDPVTFEAIEKAGEEFENRLVEQFKWVQQDAVSFCCF